MTLLIATILALASMAFITFLTYRVTALLLTSRRLAARHELDLINTISASLTTSLSETTERVLKEIGHQVVGPEPTANPLTPAPTITDGAGAFWNDDTLAADPTDLDVPDPPSLRPDAVADDHL